MRFGEYTVAKPSRYRHTARARPMMLRISLVIVHGLHGMHGVIRGEETEIL